MLHWSDLDYKRFNLKTAKLSVVQDLEIQPLLSSFKKEGGQFLIAKCDTSLNQSLNTLFEEGFFVTDTILTYSINVDVAPVNLSRSSSVDVQSADKSVSDTLGEIARKAFKDYRSHYHNNPRLDDTLCDELYIDWANNLVLREGMADVVFTCSYNGNIAGFASLKKIQNEVAVAGLLCVDPEYEGEGIARILHQKRFEWCNQKGIKNFQINTSINNQKYINLLMNMGYSFHSGTYVLHLNNF